MLKSAACLWADALESGNYQQHTDTALRRYNDDRLTYSACGVFVDVMILDGVMKRGWILNGDFTYRCGRHADRIPVTLTTAYGLHDPYGLLRTYQNNRYKSITDMNAAGISFKEIAAFIRKNYKDL